MCPKFLHKYLKPTSHRTFYNSVLLEVVAVVVVAVVVVEVVVVDFVVEAFDANFNSTSS